jgi:hypothetical protein
MTDRIPDCRRCEQAEFDRLGLTAFGRVTRRTFIVCRVCGNKRCPKATDHDLACTGSNESGQPGSDYP